jgi:hypothetical protein
MFVRILGNWGRYKDGECHEVHERVGAGWVARGGAEEITYEAYRAYQRGGLRADVFGALDKEKIARDVIDARTGRRVVTEDEWKRQLGGDQPGYAAAARKHYAGAAAVSAAQGNVVLDDNITVRGV